MGRLLKNHGANNYYVRFYVYSHKRHLFWLPFLRQIFIFFYFLIKMQSAAKLISY